MKRPQAEPVHFYRFRLHILSQKTVEYDSDRQEHLRYHGHTLPEGTPLYQSSCLDCAWIWA
jgi:hypothetical protein